MEAFIVIRCHHIAFYLGDATGSDPYEGSAALLSCLERVINLCLQQGAEQVRLTDER